MSSNVAALPPPTHHIPHRADNDGEPDVPEYAFSELWQDTKEGVTFGDVLDIINPLQHIPVVSTFYRMATEDDIGVGSRILGGALFGGPLGVLITGLTAIIEEISGGTVDDHVASLWNTISDEDNAAPQIASAGGKKNYVPPTLPLMEDDPAADTITSTPSVAEPKPLAGSVQGAAITAIAAPRMPGPAQLSPRPLPTPPVTVAPLTAVHRVHSRSIQSQQAQPVTTDHGAERQRIANAIEHAQRAQAGLLLASLGANNTDRARDAGDQTTTQQNQPFKAHPYLLPRGAPPQLISRAMEQAMAKYQATMQQRSGDLVAGSPRPTPSPVR